MTRCIQCGKEAPFCLCDECTAASDIEQLCIKGLSYDGSTELHPLWSEIRNSLGSADNFKYIAFALSDGLPSLHSHLTGTRHIPWKRWSR